MSIFDVLRKAPAPQPKQYAFTLSDHYKGYKRFNMAVYGEGDAEKNNKALRDVNLAGQQIVFAPGSYDGNHKMMSVFICGKHVGSIYDAEQISEMESGIITKVYAKIQDEQVGGYENGKAKIEDRPRIHLFVKKGD